MTDLEERIRANRVAMDDLVTTAQRNEAAWATPRAPGKWSPAQIVEHVARSLEAGANIMAGRPSALPTFPGFVRPLARGLVFKRVLKTERFPKSKTNKAMNPLAGPETPAEGRARLEAACTAYEQECRSLAERSPDVVTGVFGRVAIADYTRFMELHTRHHLAQMPQA